MTHPVDAQVGRIIRRTREARDITQAELAKVVDVSFQQMQKYERGINRVSASRLYEIAKALNVPVVTFFPEDANSDDGLRISDKDERDMLLAFRQLQPHQRPPFLGLAKAVVDATPAEAAA